MRTDETHDGSRPRRTVVDTARLPALSPTHFHDGSLWEALGRAVATFGFLKEVLSKAIFAFIGTGHQAEINVMKHMRHGCRPFGPCCRMVSNADKSAVRFDFSASTRSRDMTDVWEEADLCYNSERTGLQVGR